MPRLMLRPATALVVAVLLISAPPPVPAELVYFQAGGRAQVPAKVVGDSVTIDSPAGAVAFLRSDFKRIVPGHDPRSEWPVRRSKVRETDADAMFRTAWWALENGLPTEALGLLRELHTQHPEHRNASRMVKAADRLTAKVEDPDLSFLPDGTLPGRRHRTSHILLCHDLTDAEALERAEMLEAVVLTYQLILTGWGLELEPPTRRLASVYVSSKAKYLALFEQIGVRGFNATRGYYHPTMKVVFAYDTRVDEAQVRARTRIAGLRRQAEGFSKALDRAEGLKQARLEVPSQDGLRKVTRVEAAALLDDRRREILRQQLLTDLDWRAIDLGIAAHETIHQLAVETKLVRRFDEFPTWLHEGLAAQFEVVRGGRWSGFLKAHDLRLPDARKLSPLPGVETLVRGRSFGPGYDRDRYAAAWSFVDYLASVEPESLIAFLEILRTNEPGTPRDPSARIWQAFQRSFSGSTEDLGSGWRQHLDGRLTPLEQNDPGT